MTNITPIKPKVAFLYPGQGAVPEKSPKELFEAHLQIGKTYSHLTTQFCPSFEDFHQQSEMSDLKAQLGVYNLSFAMGQAVVEAGIQPDCVAGYSSGLYAALAAAGGCSAERGPEIILQAYDLMAACDLKTEYRMVAVIGIDCDTIGGILAPMQPGGWISLINNRRQLIVSIPRQEVAGFTNKCNEEGALRVVELPFERPCHIPPLQSAGTKLLSYFDASPIEQTRIPFLAGEEPQFIRTGHEVAKAVGDQLWHQVNWHRTVKALVNSGVNVMVCLDPTGVLGRIVRWITREVQIISIQSSEDLSKLKAQEFQPACRAGSRQTA